MASDMSALTDMWMLNPTMFDPTQASNQFSNFNNAPFPFPPTYNTGAGGPVNAATGKPIQSFQTWQQQNPGGVNINATPAQPQAMAAAPTVNPGALGSGAGAAGGSNPFAQFGVRPGAGDTSGAVIAPATRDGMPYAPMGVAPAGAYTGGQQVVTDMIPQYGAASGERGGQQPTITGYTPQYGYVGGQPTAPAAAPSSGSGAPNNWYAALNALSAPGNPVTQGATVPMAQGFQPSGGVNQAFLQQAGAGQGMNPNFLSALSAIQKRPQGVA